MMRPATIASIMVLGGIAAQGIGLYGLAGGHWIALAVVGTEMAALGLVGVLRNAG